MLGELKRFTGDGWEQEDDVTLVTLQGRLHEVAVPGMDDGLCAALHAEFATDVIDVPLDRVHTQNEAVGDLTVGRALKQQP